MWQPYISAVQSQELQTETNGSSFISLSLSLSLKICGLTSPENWNSGANLVHSKKRLVDAQTEWLDFRKRDRHLNCISFLGTSIGGRGEYTFRRDAEPGSVQEKKKFVLKKLLIGYQLFCNEWNNYMIYIIRTICIKFFRHTLTL